MRKTLVLLLLLSLCFALGTTAYADDTIYSEGYFYYTENGGSITIVGYFGRETEAHIPSAIAGFPVNRIAAGAFLNTSLEVLYLPDTIMEIEENAFPPKLSVIHAGLPTPPEAPSDEGTPLPTPNETASAAPASEATASPAASVSASPSSEASASPTPAPSADESGDSGWTESEVIFTPVPPMGNRIPDGEQTDSPAADEEMPELIAPAPAEDAPAGTSDTATGSKTPLLIGIAAAVIVCAAAAVILRKKKKG